MRKQIDASGSTPSRYGRAFVATAAVGALAWGVHVWGERAANTPYSDARPLRLEERLLLTEGLVLAHGEGLEPVDPHRLDVTLDRARICVRGREVAAVPSDGGAFAQTGESPLEIRPLALALDFWRDLRDATDEGSRALNVVIDARMPYAIVAAVIFTLSMRAPDTLHFIVQRADGTLGGLLPLRGGQPSCRLAVLPEAGGYVMDRPYPSEDRGSARASAHDLATMGGGGFAAPVPEEDTPNDPCFPPTRDTLFMPILSPGRAAPFQDVVAALEAAQTALGGATLSLPRDP